MKYPLSFEKKIIAYFFLLILIVSSIILIYQKMTAKYKSTKDWVSQTENVLTLTDTITSRYKDMVIGVRGYIITGDADFLESDQQTKDSVYSDLNRLKKLTKDDLYQGKRLDTLTNLIDEYFAVVGKAIKLRKEAAFSLEQEIPLIEAANHTLVHMFALFHSMKQEEKSLLKERKKNYQESLKSAVLAMRILVLFFVISLVFALIVAYRNSVKRNRIEKALRKSEGLIRGIIDHAPVLVNVKDRSGNYMLANKQFANILNATPDELVGKSSYKFLPSEIANRMDRDDKEVIETLEPSEIEVKLPAPDGLHTYIVSKFPLFDDKGKLYAIGSTSSDITPVKTAHEALVKSYEQQQKVLNGLQEVLTTSSDLICTVNENGDFVLVSDTSQKLFGYTPKEMMNKGFMEFVAEQDRAETEKVANDIMSGIPVSDFTNHYKRKDGFLIPVIWSAKWSPEDKMMYCVARNGTEKVKTAAQLAESESRLAHAQTIAKLGNWDWDLKNDVWTCSNEIYHLLGVEKNETDNIQQVLLESIYPDDRFLLFKMRDEAINEGKKIDVEHRIIRADGGLSYMHTKGEMVLDKEQKPVWFRGTMQDITERKNAELELQKLNEDLEKRAAELKISNGELERFAYVASHDLQEPLRMVSSFLALLQKKLNGELDETSKKYIHFAVDGAERMKGLIQDLLQYSRLGSTGEVFSAVNLQDELTNILRVYDSTIKKTGAAIKAAQLPVVNGNKTQLNQLFQNLLGNALKYRSSEKPVVEIGCKEQAGQWLFYVKDNGIGIDPKFFDKIFIIFQRLHNKNEYSGTGIGLAICKKIVERHGGKIWVESNPNQGSIFYFTLKKQEYV